MDRRILNRRMFLSDLGKGTLAIAILGAGACSSGATSTSPTSGPAGGSEVPPTTTRLLVPSSTGSAPTAMPAAGELDWERVNLGFVSAYVLARGNRAAIVDTGVAGSAAQIDEALQVVGLTWGEVDHVLLTHMHGDHVGSVGEVLDAASAATGYAGAADVGAIGSPRPLEPVFDGDEVFGLQVIGTPGHTEGHISVLDREAGLLVAGDALNGDDGLITGPNPQFTSDIERANASVKRLAQEQFDTAVFGHGDPVTTGASDLVRALAETL
ncbi:MAG: MBL fold metallo-hydrolase [Acidimicrobiales bacterium]|nr:MBL fold metallo-hydrolase [Acidimicrobiales bacterium]